MANIIALDEVEIESMEVFGDEVLITLRARAHGREAGFDIGKIQVFHVARVRDEKVVRVRVYLDEQQAREAARTKTG